MFNVRYSTVSASYSTETIRGYPSFPDAEHPGASTDCVVVAMSRGKQPKNAHPTTSCCAQKFDLYNVWATAMTYITESRDVSAAGLTWRSFFVS